MARMFVSLANEGPSPLTEVVLDFAVPGEPLGLRIGDPTAPGSIAEFKFRNRPVSRTNPLPPGDVAWTKRLTKLVDGSTLRFNQYGYMGNGVSDMVSVPVEPDVTVHKFDYPHYNVPGGRLAGTVRFVTQR
jgi:hypothetical protein